MDVVIRQENPEASPGSSTVTDLEVYGHEAYESVGEGGEGEEAEEDQDFEEDEEIEIPHAEGEEYNEQITDEMDYLLSGEQGWETDMDESDDEVKTNHYSQPTLVKEENMDNMETLEIPVESIESQWRLCVQKGEDLAVEIESEDEEAKATNKDSNLLAYDFKHTRAISVISI